MNVPWQEMLLPPKNEKMIDYIQKSLFEYNKLQREFTIFGNTMVFIKDHLPDHINVKNVIVSVETLIPRHLTNEIDMVYIGQFKDFEDRDINSMFKDASIFVTNEQDDDDDMIDDIVHEVAHSIEDSEFGSLIYGDDEIELEFLGKRKRLYFIMKNQGIDVNSERFMTITHTQKFDDYLYKQIGYDHLTNLAMGLFISPYSITDIREYFATGFVEYLMGDREYLRTVSPFLYKKIEELVNYESEY